MRWPLAAIFVLGTVCSGTWAAWPERPVRVVVGYTAAGTTDIVARIIAQELTNATGQTFIVDNKPGANSNIGSAEVAKAKPDGYTLLIGTISNTTNVSMYKDPGYDLLRDLAPVAMIGSVPNVLAVTPSFAVHSVKDYVEFAKSHPNEVTYASAGSGSSTHLSAELFAMTAGVKMIHVPYRGSAPAVTDLLSGQVKSMFDNLPSALPHIKANKLRALAVTSPERAPQLPDVPTMQELGFPGFEAYSWTGFMVPTGTPKEVIDKLATLTAGILKKPAVEARLLEVGVSPRPLDTTNFDAFVRSEIKKWAAVVKQSGARVD